MNKKAHIVLNEVTSSVRPMMERFIESGEYPEDMFLKGPEAAGLADPGTMLVVVDVNRPSITDEPLPSESGADHCGAGSPQDQQRDY